MEKAVIYARYSSDAQKETSITDQIRDCRDYASKNNFIVIHEYKDEAMTGKNDNRPEFQQMLSDSNKQLFTVLIVWKLDRFARNRNESALNKIKLKKNGVRVLSAMEHIPDGPEGIILESVLEGLAEYYVYDLKEKTSRGRRGLALQCKHCGGRPLLGYKVNPDKTYGIDEYNAEAVRKIFDMYASGSSYSQIIDQMNSEGRKTGAGKPFGKNSLHELLKNERYIGTYTYNKIPNTEGKRNSHASNPEDKIIRIKNGIPAIISNDVWKRVQDRMDKNRHAPAAHKAKINYLLSGKLFCGHCGGAMVGQSSGDHTTYSYYECSTKKRLRTCHKTNVKKETIENVVLNATMKYVLSDKACDDIAELVAAASQKENSKENESAGIRKEITKNQNEINNMLKAIKAGIITDSTKAELDRLEARRKRLNEQLDETQFFHSKERTKEGIRFWLDRFRDMDITDEECCKELMDLFVNSVFVYDDGTAIITYNLNGDNKEKISLKDIQGIKSPAPKLQKPHGYWVFSNLCGFSLFSILVLFRFVRHLYDTYTEFS